jgi:hypothetical protein
MSYSKRALVATASALALFLCSPAFAGGDTCGAAQPLGTAPIGATPFDTTSVSASGFNPGCGGGTNPQDWWYSFVMNGDDEATISTCNSANYDTRLAVLDSCGGSVEGCNDDGGGCSGFSSLLTIGGLTPGAQYFLQVGGYNGASGTGTFTITTAAGPPPGILGPDIAVSGIGDGNYNNYGTSGGVRAYAFATTSCNVGDERVNWFSGIGNDHPVIAQNMFRIDNGRIEQLGYSWLKHGFFALSQPGCTTTPCQGTNGSELGIGCADTYSAGLNDGSDGAGKFSVNATTGTYSGNPLPTTGNSTIRGRLQVLDSELTGTVIAESQYISEHDHGEGNGRNNASYRFLNVAGNGDLSDNGPVHRYEPAIMAWGTQSGATINEVVNSNEGGSGIHGYFFVGFQATNLGGGQWRYEYAVQNLNSDASARQFEVPVPNSTNLTNLFFRDVNKHSGSPYSNTDWTFSHSGNAARWQTETFAQNSDANAIRWGTLYNFGFTANGAPQTVLAELDLFKTGGTLTSSVDGPQGGGIVDCNNNSIDDSIDIAGGTSDDCNNNNTPDECESLADCNSNGTPDECESLADCNSNGTPDVCESLADCNSNGTPDVCESLADCNNNGTPDDCEGLADCNSNGTPDVCESLADCNNNGTPDVCEGLADCDNDGTPDVCETDCNNNGTPDDCESLADCNNNGTPDPCEGGPDCNSNGVPDDCEPDCDLDFIPDGCEVDCNNNGTPDDCESLADCNSNGTPDVCESLADCNSNGTPDVCEGLADCNSNGTPDVCESLADCNSNGTPDVCESLADCNSNGTPDVCESLADCDNDGTPDVCETDCDSDGTPDDCEVDCDNNGVPDDCDFFIDCNFNGVPDDCEADCNSNFTPDACDISVGTSQDCDVNGIPDECDLSGGAPDCNNNGIPDACDVASGGSFDGNSNGVPDECEVDCNSNGVNDTTDITSGTSVDTNSNGIPDECEALQTGYGFCVSGPCANDYPTAGCLTSTGVGASIVATGSSSVASDDMFISMTGLPLNEFGLFFAAPIQGAGFPFGDGIRVAVGSTNRFPIQNSGGAGSIAFGPVVSYANSNFPVSGMITAGSNWNFQGWFRDPMGLCGSSFNLTHGLSVDFTP